MKFHSFIHPVVNKYPSEAPMLLTLSGAEDTMMGKVGVDLLPGVYSGSQTQLCTQLPK